MRGNADTHDLVAPGNLGAVLAAACRRTRRVDADCRRHGADGRICRGPARPRRSLSACGAFPICAPSRSRRKASSSAQPPRFSICAGTPSSPPSCRCSPKPQAGSAPSPTRAAPRSAAISSTDRRPRIPRLRCWLTTPRSSSSPCADAAAFPTPNFTPATSAMCSRPMNCSYAIHLPRRFAHHAQYLRKVGTRRAMAIAKVALGATALLENGVIREIRLGAASLAPFPTRLFQTEAALLGQTVTRDTIQSARPRTARRNEADRRHSFHCRIPAARGSQSARRISARTSRRRGSQS